MASIAKENDSTLLKTEADPLVRLVQVTLAVYLLPVVTIVLAIGGISLLAGKVTRAASRLAIKPPGIQPIGPGPGVRRSTNVNQGRSRVGR